MPTRSRLISILLIGVISIGNAARGADVSGRRYPGELTLDVDLTDPAQRIFRVHERIPVSPGSLTLYYPKWIPGEHSPSGTIDGAPGMVVVAIDGRKFDKDQVDEMLLDAESGKAPIEVLARNYDAYSTVEIDYRDGPKYPHLTQIAGGTDFLKDIIAAKSAP
jgi:hypothetical protein